MTKRQICIIFMLLVLLFSIIFALNFYFLTRLNDQITTDAMQPDSGGKSLRAWEKDIRRRVATLKPVYLNRNPRFYVIRNQLLRTLKPVEYSNVSTIWEISKWWPNKNEIYPQSNSVIGAFCQALNTETILAAQNYRRGTQLKLQLTLTGMEKVVFKPKWYERDRIIDGPVYAGKDRHDSEIVGFYLGAILNMRWTPITVGRYLNLEHIYAIADRELRRTMSMKLNESTICLYGKCHYCKESEPVCGDTHNRLEGAILQIIPGTLTKYRSPWQRTYKDGQQAEWETNPKYCKSLKSKFTPNRLLDLIDASIFDFLIQNGDRHHYETRDDRIILIDNGKGFGNPHIDFMDILAPLYQCCWLRKTTWERLQFYSGDSLGDLLDDLTKFDVLYPILNDAQLNAMNRRMSLIFAAVDICIEKYGSDVLK